MATMIVLSALAVLGLTVLLPLVTFVRMVSLSKELAALRARFDALERAAAGQPTAYSPRDAATAVPRMPAGAPSPASAPEVTTVPIEAADAGGAVTPPAATPPPALSPPPDPVTATAATPARPQPSDRRRGFDEGRLEAAIGGRLLLYVGAAALVLGLAFFLKYAFDRAWITETMRVVLGAAAGLALVTGGLRLARRGYRVYGQILAGGGFAALYLSTYAAFDFYRLIDGTTAFAVLLAITVAAAVLSDRERSQGMAVMAVGGGFLTPFLVGGSADAQVTLFTYVALLIAGTMYLSHRRRWPVLNVLSFALTVVTVAAWASVHYTPAKYLRTQLFLTLFCGMFLAVLRDMWAPGGHIGTGAAESAAGTAARAGRLVTGRTIAGVLLIGAPALYHLASLAVLFRHGVALLVYLIAVTVVGVAWSVRVDRARYAPLLWAAAMLPLLGWIGEYAASRWLLPASITLGTVFALHLLAQFDRLIRQRAQLGGPDLLLLHLNGLGLFFGMYLLLEPVALAWIPRVGAALVVVHAAIAWRLRLLDATAALHGLAVAFSLLAATIAVRLDGAWLTAAFAAEGAAVMWVGLRAHATWFRGGGVALLIVASVRWLLLTVSQTPASFQLVLNESFLVGVWIIGLLYVMAWFHRGAPRRWQLATLLIAASVLTIVLLSQQNASFWELRRPVNADAWFAQSLSLSVIWVLYAAVLILAGIARRYPPIRYIAIILFGLTILKVFLVDLSDLEGIYRVLGLMIVGAVLLSVSFLYQRIVRPQAGRPEEEPAA